MNLVLLVAKCVSPLLGVRLTLTHLLQELTKILKANHMVQTDAEVARKADTIMSQVILFTVTAATHLTN